MILRFDRARSGRPVGSKTLSGRARSGLFRVDFSGFRVFPDHVARSRKNYQTTRAESLMTSFFDHVLHYKHKLRVLDLAKVIVQVNLYVG